MRKTLVLATVAFLALAGCGASQVNIDAKQMADVKCKSKKIAAEAENIQQQHEQFPNDQEILISLARIQNDMKSLEAESVKIISDIETRYKTAKAKNTLLAASVNRLGRCMAK
jgi:cytochrome c556